MAAMHPSLRAGVSSSTRTEGNFISMFHKEEEGEGEEDGRVELLALEVADVARDLLKQEKLSLLGKELAVRLVNVLDELDVRPGLSRSDGYNGLGEVEETKESVSSINLGQGVRKAGSKIKRSVGRRSESQRIFLGHLLGDARPLGGETPPVVQRAKQKEMALLRAYEERMAVSQRR